jgi:hypothetical protein
MTESEEIMFENRERMVRVEEMLKNVVENVRDIKGEQLKMRENFIALQSTTPTNSDVAKLEERVSLLERSSNESTGIKNFFQKNWYGLFMAATFLSTLIYTGYQWKQDIEQSIKLQSREYKEYRVEK